MSTSDAVSTPARPRLRLALAGGACLCLLAAGCDEGPVSVDAGPAADAAECDRLLDALPDQVDDEDARDVEPKDAQAAAWGDPAIVLRCGVARPAALVRTSYCAGVSGVGWLATQDGVELDPRDPVDGTLTFTTIGRSAYVEVTVPDAYQPQVDPLVALAPAIKAATQQETPCL